MSTTASDMGRAIDEGVTSPGFFEAMYRRNADPWDFGSNAYELERYDIVIRALAGRRFRRGFEPGCSVGVLTQRLAGLCDALEAVDCSATAIETARQRCVTHPQVRFHAGALPEALPAGSFDLIVLSEIGYYFSLERWPVVADRIVSALHPGGTLLAAHWLGHSPDHCISGDDVHATLQAHAALRLEHSERHERAGREAGFRLDRWVRA